MNPPPIAAADVATHVTAGVAAPSPTPPMPPSPPIANMLPMPPNSRLPISMPESMSVPLHRL